MNRLAVILISLVGAMNKPLRRIAFYIFCHLARRLFAPEERIAFPTRPTGKDRVPSHHIALTFRKWLTSSIG